MPESPLRLSKPSTSQAGGNLEPTWLHTLNVLISAMLRTPLALALITCHLLCHAAIGQVTAPGQQFPPVPSKSLPEAGSAYQQPSHKIWLTESRLLHGANTPYPGTTIEEVLYFGTFTGETTGNLGGANKAFQGRMSYRGITLSVFVKPDCGLKPDGPWPGVPVRSDNRRADAAFHLNSFINLVDTPEDVISTDVPTVADIANCPSEVHGIGGVQAYIQDTVHPSDFKSNDPNYNPQNDPKIKIRLSEYRFELEDIALFDSIINNLDRHDGNWLFRKAPNLQRCERHIVAIDQGSTFPTERDVVGGARKMQELYLVVTNNEGPISNGNLNKLNMLVARHREVDQVLSLNLEQVAIDLMWERVEEMRMTRRIPRLPGKRP